MKKQAKILSLLLAVGMTFGVTACGGGSGGGNSDSEQTLDIYLLEKGYGKLWLESAITRFKNEEWVKEKYPNLAVNFTPNAEDAHAPQKLSAGESINKYDLMFGVNLQSSESSGLLADLTDIVYLAEVPGEAGVKVIDKIPQRVLDTVNYKDAKPREDGNDSYFVTSYIQGMFGMLYNADLLKQMNLEVPLTTDEFLSTAATIKSTKYDAYQKEDIDYVIMHAANDDYWRNSFDIWWAQYEGVKGYEDYFQGKDEAEGVIGSSTVLDQTGRLKSLQVIEKILTNYAYENAQSVKFKEAQAAYLMGQGVFHFNGDYFASEMSADGTIDSLKAMGVDYDIRYMKMPVISAIIERTPTIKNDAELKAVIQEIDANKSYAESAAKDKGVSAADYAIIVEARGLGSYCAANHQSAVIPSYAKGKALAADFLRFMYTDESIKDFTTSSGGILFPSTYDILNDATIMQSVQPIHKSKMEMMKGTSNCEFKYLPAASATLLGKAEPALESLYFSGKFEVYFAQGNPNNTAAQILANEKAYWNATTWGQMLASVGLAANG